MSQPTLQLFQSTVLGDLVARVNSFLADPNNVTLETVISDPAVATLTVNGQTVYVTALLVDGQPTLLAAQTIADAQIVAAQLLANQTAQSAIVQANAALDAANTLGAQTYFQSTIQDAHFTDIVGSLVGTYLINSANQDYSNTTYTGNTIFGALANATVQMANVAYQVSLLVGINNLANIQSFNAAVITSQYLMVSNPKRQGFIIENDSNKVFLIAFANVATASQFTLTIQPATTYVSNTGYTGDVAGIMPVASAAANTIHVTEMSYS